MRWFFCILLSPHGCALLFSLGLVGVVEAAPGPDTVAIIVNSNDADSVTLGERYAAARDVPPTRLCRLDLPAGD